MTITFVLSTAKTAETKFWKRDELDLEMLLARLVKHERRDRKDGRAFMPGALIGEFRKEIAVERVDLLIYDIDGAQTLEEVHRLLTAADKPAILYTTHSHRVSRTAIETDKYKKWADKVGANFPPASCEDMARFCQENGLGHLVDDEFAFDASNREQNTKGICYVVRHRPVDKVRVVILLATPIVIAHLGDTTKEAIETYKSIYRGVGRALGLDFDTSCEDPSRMYYFPSCPPGAEPETRLYGVDLATKYDNPADAFLAKPWLDWTDETKYPRIATDRVKSKPSKGNSPSDDGRQSSFIFEGMNLKAWAAQYARAFDIEALFRDRGFVKTDRSDGGVFVECHQEGHSGGEAETFAKNGDGEKGFTIYCSGHTGDCHRKDRLQHLLGYLHAGRITLEDLKNTEYGGGEISNRAGRERTQAGSNDNRHRAVDRDGIGFDAAMFCKCGLKLLDFGALNDRCQGSVQIGEGVSADDLAEHIRANRLAVEDLMACIMPAEGMSGYEKALRDLAMKKRRGMLQAELDKELATAAKAHGTKKGAIKDDFKTVLDKLEEERVSLGVLSPEETANVARGIDFSDQFVIVNTGGKAVVLNTYEPDLSKAIMSHDDFVKLHRDSWCVDKDDKVCYPAQDWLIAPPEEARFYRGGLVFKPTSTTRSNIGADQYNLYSGFLVAPDPSGSCSVFHDLLREVWVQGNTELFEWVLEYFMHPLRFPGDKVGTALAIRGTHGDGKSIVTEKLMAPIYGDMLLRVSNDRMVLGDFNEALAAKLMIALEEAAFAGDKKAFAKMKELVTGDTVLINPKHKAPITLDNYARMIIISNQSHFMDIEPGDRRYTVLNSMPVWKGTNKFEALLDQWNNHGGAARFVYEAMNHGFRRVEGGKQFVINTKIKTEHEVKQGASSRGPLEKFLVSLLVSGAVKERSEILEDAEWSLDEELPLAAIELRQAVTDYYHDHAPSKMAHVPQFHEIYEKLEEYYGKSPSKRAPSGIGALKGPSYRLLPRRRDALMHAYRNGRITRDEFLTAIDAEVAVSKITTYAVLAK